jgi:hypothetical protein
MNRLADNAVFQQGGNAFGATAVLGTTDARPLEVIVAGVRGLRLNYVADPDADGMNVVAGHPINSVNRVCPPLGCLSGDPVRGGTVSGGGSGLDPATANRVTDSWGTVAGGYGNLAGNENSSHGDAGFAMVGGGTFNRAEGGFSFIGGGTNNQASGMASAIPGGRLNIVSGDYSFAAGNRAIASANNCFVWSGPVDLQIGTSCVTPGGFVARAVGGFRLLSTNDIVTGCFIAAGGGAWSCSSSREVKEDFAAVDARAVLERVAALPITTWRYRDEAGRARHLGPTSEDFSEAFGLGGSSKEIGLLDGAGVALAAIQGLNAKLEADRAAQDAQIAALRAELAELRSVRNELAAIRAALAAIKGAEAVAASSR